MKQQHRITLVAGILVLFAAGLWFGLQWYQQNAAALNLKKGEDSPSYLAREVKKDTEYVLVKTSKTASLKALEATEQLEEDTTFPGLNSIGIKRFKVKGESTAEEVADRMDAKLKAEEIDSFAQVDAEYPPEYTPNDPYTRLEWYLTKTSAFAAWDVYRGSDSVSIAVLDSGLASQIPDMAGKIVPGWNTYDNNSNTEDVSGHGTRVAGVATALTDNGIGVATICWHCKIMPFRVTGTDGYGSSSRIADALIRAGNAGARVANISFGVSQDSAVRSAAQQFESKGGVVAVAAGNSALVHTAPDNPYVLTVSATDTYDALYSWSDRGSDIDIASPGFVFTTIKDGTYSSGAGTSFAAPSVASLAGLIIGAKPSLTGREVQNLIKTTADDLGSAGWDSLFGWGRYNVHRAILAATGGSSGGGDTTAPSAPSGLTAKSLSNTSVGLSWTSSTDNVGVTEYQIYRNGALVRSVASSELTYTDSGLTSGATYTYYVTAKDAAGNVSGASNSASVTLPQGFAWTTLPYVSSKTTNTAVVKFGTNSASTATVEYWVRDGAHQTVTSGSATSHEVTLSNLTANTKYSYFVRVVAADGTVLTSATSTFTTRRR